MDAEAIDEVAGDKVSIIKRGEIVIQCNLKRNTVGLFINVKVHPGIEEFSRGLGTGDLQDVRTLGRYWTPVSRRSADDSGLAVYNMMTNPGIVTNGNGTMFRLDKPGQNLTEGSGTPILGDRKGSDYPCVNLSFLRLCGISDGAGVNFHVKGVYTEQAVRQLADQIKDACRAFYVVYLKPIDMDVMVSTQEKSV